MRFGPIACFTALFAAAVLSANADRPAARSTKAAKPVSIAKSAPAPPRPVEFLRDVAPILDRGGCSVRPATASSEGAAGFRSRF